MSDTTVAPLRKVANSQNEQIGPSNKLATHSGGVPSLRLYVAGIGSDALPVTLRGDGGLRMDFFFSGQEIWQKLQTEWNCDKEIQLQ